MTKKNHFSTALLLSAVGFLILTIFSLVYILDRPIVVDGGPPPTGGGTVQASQFSGADLGEKVKAALQSLPESGGVIDARDISGAQSIRSPLVIGSASKPAQLLLGAGSLTVTGTISVGQRSSILGMPSSLASAATTIRAADNSNLDAVVSLDGGYAVLQDVVVDGNKSHNSGGGAAIRVKQALRPGLFRVTALNAPGNGISIISSGGLQRPNEAAAGRLLDVMALGNQGDGLYAFNTTDWFIVQSGFENNGRNGIELQGSPAFRIINSDLGGNGIDGIKIHSRPEDSNGGQEIISTCQFGNNTQHDIEIQGSASGGLKNWGNLIEENSFVGSHSRAHGQYDAIHIQDSRWNLISSNYINSFQQEFRYGIGIFESRPGLELTDSLIGNNLVGTFGASSWVGTATTSVVDPFGGLRLSPAGPPPACNDQTRGMIWSSRGGPGARDSFQVCAKDESDHLAWRRLY